MDAIVLGVADYDAEAVEVDGIKLRRLVCEACSVEVTLSEVS